jgi:hypothetical protein
MGKERVRVLVAFWLLWGASFQVSKGFRENVIVTHTRVRIPLGTPSCLRTRFRV